MNTILELVDQPANVLINPQTVIDALSMDPEIGPVEIEIVRVPEFHGIQVWFGFTGLDDQGQPAFTELDGVEFVYRDFAEFITAGSLLSIRTYLMECAS